MKQKSGHCKFGLYNITGNALSTLISSRRYGMCNSGTPQTRNTSGTSSLLYPSCTHMEISPQYLEFMLSDINIAVNAGLKRPHMCQLPSGVIEKKKLFITDGLDSCPT